jgi:hypothetical protein
MTPSQYRLAAELVELNGKRDIGDSIVFCLLF